MSPERWARLNTLTRKANLSGLTVEERGELTRLERQADADEQREREQ